MQCIPLMVPHLFHSDKKKDLQKDGGTEVC